MIVDSILATPGLIERIREAGDRGALVIVVTHILRDQLAATSDETRRGQLLSVYEALPKEAVPTSAFVLGASRLDSGELGDDATAISIGKLKTPGGLRGSKDALLALTASEKADVLVTEDGDLRKRLDSSVRCEFWDFEHFRQFVESAR